MIAAREATEKVQEEVEEEEEGHEALVVRKSKRLARGKLLSQQVRRGRRTRPSSMKTSEEEEVLGCFHHCSYEGTLLSFSLIFLFIVVVPNASKCLSSFII